MTSKTSAEVREQPRDTTSRDRAGAARRLPHLHKGRTGGAATVSLLVAAVVVTALW